MSETLDLTPLAPAVFDVCGELPTGTTVLEASAGTGKTFTIAALATRYVAEGVAELPELLLVTFGRAATSELRDRVRDRLVRTERALRSPDARESADAVVRHLADCDDAELALRRERLTRALSQFDAATIATTHGFCQQMLTTLGTAADVDPDARFVPDLTDLVDEVVDDLYLQRYADQAEPVLRPSDARRVAAEAMSDPQARLEPATADPGSPAGHRYAFARDVVDEVDRRKRERRLLDFDDLQTRLRDALADPAGGPAAAARVRARYAVVLVDEFQDTDPVQWEILRTAFHGHRTLVLIGDPKQAIYAFRGGDVVTYLAARADATTTATLGRSWRSDAPLLRGLETVLRGAALGDERIVVRPLQAQHMGRRLDGGAPVRIRHVTREPLGVRGTRNAAIGAVRELVYADVAADVVRQLRSTRLRDGEAWRPLQPGDVAVLARRNADAAAVRDALVAAGVPAVVSGLSSVFGTPAAQDWLTLLGALEQPGHHGRAAALALTPFVGWDAARLATATDAERDELSDTVRAWARALADKGVAALLEAVAAGGVAERLLRTAAGERTLTDVRHVGQALHLAAVEGRLGPAALTDWLRRRIAEAGEDYAEERSRRLETDAAAVQVVTVHASKGLEFPVVYVPFAWDRYEDSRRPPVALRFHDDLGARILHVGGQDDVHHKAALERHLAEDRGEDLRLLYVALTRAANQVVTWWAPSNNSGRGALSRVLLGDHAPGMQPPGHVPQPTDEAVAQRLAALAAASDGTVAVETVTARPEPVRWTAPAESRPDLGVARFDRRLDLAWRRTSYSGLTAAAHEHPGVASEPEEPGVQDEVDVALRGAARADHPARAVVSPLADMPAGAAFGTLVHEVLEHVDTTAPDLRAEIARRCAEAGAARMPGVDDDELAAALEVVLDSPLGPLAGGRTLREVRPADRLAELEFELPLAGGDTPRGASRLDDVAALLRRHLAPDDPFAPYPDLLEALGESRLRGYLTGSIDAVLRVRSVDVGPDGGPRYLVVDYKTNRLGVPDEPLTAWHYRPEAMAEAMMRAHYPLQLLLYLAALHRFLRWRQPGYDPDVHLAGGLYLFVRGMCGPSTPVFDDGPAGVMAWRPPAGLVAALSALLDGRST
ncbi:UvrD-helicase domain-containing protein [Isoptericola variabilis]|uniref:RecBCD enzyme subunit RecB n=1 Tax=Isoptericola variabilis (strain 225) TaxID=743718 RepID=F6FX99_ISOV2|nr:UvrD-helicase domain-containing protein [Isoptericola variabilis]AEG43602.1 exodeoxyribonuclease V, beta subunit [Isoptericola variabilis 225]